jgi:peptidyl-prolyl cis-trans isomerase SurA|tara:strand:- start:669 stop:2300 length:1632 start_codon:yes stop_codon:yes gene_type:complete
MNRFFIVLSLFINFSFAQLENNILFKVNDSLVYVDEFNRVYNKNIDLIDENNQKDFESYLELFINYKLKLAEAYDLGLQNDPKYKSELNKYVKQLQNTYLTDRETEDKFLREAYERTKYEVNVSHILIRIDENDNDTIDVYNKLNNLRDPFLNSSINDFKNSHLEDEELIIENLGYFSAFKMIYKFENMAYKTPVGEVSLPFRSRFGFHILKVNDKRSSLGEVTVGHIMTYKNKPNAYERITNILDSLNNGISFEYLAKKYSDDKNSSFKGGRLNPFSSGQINSIPFENAAFELGKKNNVSKPIETKYGWHIIKFYSKKNVQKFDEIKYELLNKLKKSSRFSIVSDSFYDFLMNRYGLSYQNNNLDYFISILDPSYFKGEWSIPESIDEEKTLIKILDKNLKFIDFATFLEDNQRKTSITPYQKLISDRYKSFIKYNALEVYKNNLESENSDYKFVIKEYREGLLLFNLMQDKIWTVRDSDSTKLKMFFSENKNKYTSFEEDRGKVIGDFQQYQEELWINSLKSKHKLTINKRTVKRLKKEYN